MPEFTIQIDAPAEAVFEELSHVERHPTWANAKSKMTMEQTVGSGSGPTATYRSSGVFVGKDVSADITVTAFDPPRRFAIRCCSTSRARRTCGTSTTQAPRRVDHTARAEHRRRRAFVAAHEILSATPQS